MLSLHLPAGSAAFSPVHTDSQVAKAFWMAIGGDRDEIEGLSSDEEN